MTIEDRARDFNESIFTNGSKEKAERLVLMQDNPKRDLGGWGKKVMQDKIKDLLNSERHQLLDEILAECELASWTDRRVYGLHVKLDNIKDIINKKRGEE